MKAPKFVLPFYKTSQALAFFLFLLPGISRLQAGNIYVPNYSFESPATDYAYPAISEWQNAPQPTNYNDDGGYFPWYENTGVFLNTAPGSSDYIDNCTGNQAAFLFNTPQVALFQDHNTVGSDGAPASHAFNAIYQTGKSYHLIVGVIGGGGDMPMGATLQLSLYYRDASNNMVTVAATNFFNTTNLFPTNTHFVDCELDLPVVNATNAWVGKNIGIELLASTTDTNLIGGYWDLDNVRLTESIYVPNFSFESPTTDYVLPEIYSWQQTPQPANYDDDGGYFPWYYTIGVFTNTTYGSSNYIYNLNGGQAAYLFADTGNGIFQDYNSIDIVNPVPTHAFNAVFEAGKAYNLTVGLIGGDSGMSPGATLQLSLYYRDLSNNMVTVAATNIVYDPTIFTGITNLVDCNLHLPTVKATDVWAGQNIGIEFLSTVATNLQGGDWDLDNVRLTDVVDPALTSPAATNGQFNFTLQTEPGATFAIVTSTNLSLPVSNWMVWQTVTNLTGFASLSDTVTNHQRFYRVQPFP